MGFIESKLKRYLELFIKIIEESLDSEKKFSEEESNEFNEICKTLIEELITNPGGLIFIDEKEKIKTYKFGVEKLFELYSSEELFEEILGGGFGGLMFDELDNYVYRAKKLMPTFISIRPDSKDFFYTYYNEAMRCWLYGLTNSSLIITASLLENLLKEQINNLSQQEVQEVLKIVKADEKYKGIEVSFENLIDIAEIKGIISRKSKNTAHILRKKRNKIVHTGLNIDSDNSLELITKTKKIFEELLT